MEPVYKNVQKIPVIIGLNGGWSNHHYTDKMLIGERVTEETATHFIRNTTEVFSVEDEMVAIETQRWSPETLALHEISIIENLQLEVDSLRTQLTDEIVISNIRGDTCNKLIDDVASADYEISELRTALHDIAIIAENTIPPDGPEAAYGALDEILKIILPFRKYK